MHNLQYQTFFFWLKFVIWKRQQIKIIIVYTWPSVITNVGTYGGQHWDRDFHENQGIVSAASRWFPFSSCQLIAHLALSNGAQWSAVFVLNRFVFQCTQIILWISSEKLGFVAMPDTFFKMNKIYHFQISDNFPYLGNSIQCIPCNCYNRFVIIAK